MRGASVMSTAWEAWRAGDAAQARASAEAALARGTDVDEASHVLALAAHVLGNHAEAIARSRAIGRRYRRLAELDEPILWSHVRLGDIAAARDFADARGLLGHRGTRERLRIALDAPMRVHVAGTVELPFSDDAFSPLMPGVAARVNGRPLIVRLDSGGSYVHLTASSARALGIAYGGRERGFAALRMNPIWYGVADLELAAAHLRNVPVCVHADGTLPVGVIVQAFGARMDAIIGTNVFLQFLTTIDAPGQRLILSNRDDPAARLNHLDRLLGHVEEVPFMLLGEHSMIARGRMGETRDLNYFIDSGLAAFRSDQGQAALMVPASALDAWGVPAPREGRFAEIAGWLSLGSLRQRDVTALPVPDRTWRRFGDWSGIRVDALLSHAFLKRYRWTIDGDRGVYRFHDATA